MVFQLVPKKTVPPVGSTFGVHAAKAALLQQPLILKGFIGLVHSMRTSHLTDFIKLAKMERAVAAMNSFVY